MPEKYFDTLDSKDTVKTAWLRLLSLFIDVEATRLFIQPDCKTAYASFADDRSLSARPSTNTPFLIFSRRFKLAADGSNKSNTCSL